MVPLALSLLITLAGVVLVEGQSSADKLKDPIDIYQNPLSNGFGDDIEWVNWEDAIETALEKDKPIFLLMHKTWCHACRSLKKTMQQPNAQKAFKKLSEHFVMVNTADDDEPYEAEYQPDGKYIPRLLFLDKNGDPLLQFKNERAEYKNYGYYYSSPADVFKAMKKVLEYFGVELPEVKKAGLKPKKPPPSAKLEGPEKTGSKKSEKAKEEPKVEEQKKEEATPTTTKQPEKATPTTTKQPEKATPTTTKQPEKATPTTTKQPENAKEQKKEEATTKQPKKDKETGKDPKGKEKSKKSEL